MRKIYYSVMLCIAACCASCEFDDSELWNAVNDVNARVEALESATGRINSEVAALNTIVGALQNQLFITEVNTTAEGYEITFSDGEIARIYHGKNGEKGQDGVNAPEISLKQDTDGNYYWTLGGDWLRVDGQRVKANGTDGKDGKDGADGKDGKDGKDGENGKDGANGTPGTNGANAPQVRIHPDTKEWEISTDGGQTWTPTGVLAEGKPGADGTNGDSMFSQVDLSDGENVRFVLADGTEFCVPRYNSTMPLFIIEGADGVQELEYGTTKSFQVTADNVADFSIQKPDGWRADYSNSRLTVTAPQKGNVYAEKSGTISVVAVSANNKSMIAKLHVASFELRTLTFEDADVRFEAYEMPFGDESFTIRKWSDLIDEQQYGGSKLYGNMMSSTPYFWYDRNNTELKHAFPEMYGTYCFWSGGHAISNYGDTDIEGTGDYSNQLTVNGRNGAAGHNGSANFAIHFGYIDDSGYNMTQELPAFEFGDGVERIIDHMWVMPNNYALNCYANGNSLTPQINPGDYVKITATGYDTAANKVGETSFVLCNGKDIVVSSWSKWDLSVLGKVARVEFNILGTSDNGYGFSQPAYFAYDDVAVRFP